MKVVNYERTLIFYDGHQVVLGRDLGANPFVGVLISQGASNKYIVAQVDRLFLDAFLKGQIDLLRLMLSHVGPGWYFAEVSDGFDSPIELDLQPETLNALTYLPEPGLFIEDFKFHVTWNALKPLTVHQYGIPAIHTGPESASSQLMALVGSQWHSPGQFEFDLPFASPEPAPSDKGIAVVAVDTATILAERANNNTLALAA